MPLPLSNIDDLIDTYDVQDDTVLNTHFSPIQKLLWQNIENYGTGVNEYGEVLSAHLKRTSTVGMTFLTEALGFSAKAGRNFYEANLFQDLGKLHPAYDVGIWSLPHRPTKAERQEKRLHAARGAELIDQALEDAPTTLRNHPHIQIIKAIQLYHHERVDGTGQFGLKKDNMGQVIKAICIIDAFDGDMIHRPHQPAKRSPEKALKRLKEAKKYQGAFDKALLQRFIDFQLSTR